MKHHKIYILYFIFYILYSFGYSNQWSLVENISNDIFGSFFSSNGFGINHSGIAIDSNNRPHVTWFGQTPNRIFYSYRADNGWITPIQITPGFVDAKWPSIGIDSKNHIHLTWHDYRHVGRNFNIEIYYNLSTAITLWDNELRLTHTQDENMTNGDAGYLPIMEIDSNDALHILWYDFHWNGWRPDLVYKTAADGFSWDTSKHINSNRITFTQLYQTPSPCMAIDTENNIHIVWIDDLSGNLNIYYKNKNFITHSWSADTSLTQTTTATLYPALVADGQNNLYLFWTDSRHGNQEIYMKKYDANSRLWKNEIRITNSSGNSTHPTAAIDSFNKIHLLWQDDRNGNYAIFYKYYNPANQSWSEEMNISQGVLTSQFPSIAIDNFNNLHIVWQDNRDGNNEIYYRKIYRITGIKDTLWNSLF